MKFLEDRIRQEGQVRPGNILKVDCFLNHQLDVALLDEIGRAFYEKIQGSGHHPHPDHRGLGHRHRLHDRQRAERAGGVCQKMAKSKNLDGDVYTSVVHSFTYGRDYDITLAKKFLGPQDTVLLVDDFLAVGKAMNGMLDICNQAGARVAGIGIAIEKGFQTGGAALRQAGYDLTSLAIVDSMGDDGSITFRGEEG